MLKLHLALKLYVVLGQLPLILMHNDKQNHLTVPGQCWDLT
jgi:hypothetical protein